MSSTQPALQRTPKVRPASGTGAGEGRVEQGVEVGGAGRSRSTNSSPPERVTVPRPADGLGQPAGDGDEQLSPVSWP